MTGAALDFEHHPFEAALARAAPLAASAAARRSLWHRALDGGAGPAAAALDGGGVSLPLPVPQAEAGPLAAAAAGGGAERGSLDATLAAAHVAAAAAAAADPVASARTAAALRVEVDALTALVRVADATCPGAIGRALAHCAAVDAPTRGVPQTKVVPLSLHATLTGARCFFAGCPVPLASTGTLAIVGPLVIARQLCDPPATCDRTIPLGGRRVGATSIALKGSRPLVKAYVDLALDGVDVDALYGGGLEPTIVLVAGAGKRLSPSDPDPAAPKIATLPWWDTLRANVRGSLKLKVTRFGFDLASGASPAVCGASPRLRVTAATLTAASATGAFLDLDAAGMAVAGLGPAPAPASPGVCRRCPSGRAAALCGARAV